MSPTPDDAPDDAPDGTKTNADAERLVTKYMLGSLPLGLVVLPLIDMAALTVLQLRMLSRLASLYKIDFAHEQVTALVGSLLGGGGSVLASATSRRLLLHLIPGAGWVAAVASTSVFAGASTFAVGRVFIQHFESGGTFLTFDPDKVRQYYAEQFAQGGAAVADSFAGVRP